MAINSKQARKEALQKREQYTFNYRDRFSVLFHNSVVLEGADTLPLKIPKRYLLEILYGRGGIAYDKETGLFLPYNPIGIDVYGLPKQYQLVGFNGFTVIRNVDEVVILRTNDKAIPLSNYVNMQIEKVVDIDMAIDMNLEATKTMSIFTVEDRATLLSLANQAESRRIGASIAFIDKNAMTGNSLQVQSTGATYLVDKLLEARKEILNETYATIGISVANTDKKERVQSMEVLASQGYAKDSISAMIDTFNYDAEYGGLSIRLRANTALMTDVEADEVDEEKEVNE